jgi:hypothetical protein
MRVTQVNRAFCQELQTEKSLLEGKIIFEVGRGRWDDAKFRSALESLVRGSEEEALVTLNTMNGTTPTVRARRVCLATGGTRAILLALEPS